MHPLKIVSIILLLTGIVVFVAGMLLLWLTKPPYGWANVLITTGILFLLGAIIMLAVSFEYDIPNASALIPQLKAEQVTPPTPTLVQRQTPII